MTEEPGRAQARGIERKLVWIGWISSIVGAGVVFTAIGFLVAVFFSAEQRDRLGEDNLPLLVGSVLILGLLIRKSPRSAGPSSGSSTR